MLRSSAGHSSQYIYDEAPGQSDNCSGAVWWQTGEYQKEGDIG